jgi:hypothetical protein
VHRYVAINRREAIQPAFDALLRIVDEVLGSIGLRQSVRKRLCSGIDASRRARLCMLRSWNVMESTES